ncbi:MAG: biopolymer transporter ExbD [Gammaproteobacteria bacterium]|nr:biopolymer transporter ExbD [Gammaproteobacteria bacterium]
MRFRPKTRENGVDPNLTPLIDVVFLLLIFFMVSSTFKQESELLLDLPKANDQPVEATERVPVEVAIEADGKVYVNQHEVTDDTLNTLKNAMELAAGEQVSPAVVIRADRMAPHGRVVMALEASRLLGYSQISFATALRDGELVD